MEPPLPNVSVLVAARPEQAVIKAVDASRFLDYPAQNLEILLARGKQPSAQRNTGIRAAKGEFIYFLDDDSVPQTINLRKGLIHFEDPKVQMVGGPNVCPDEAPWLEQVFALVLGSWLAFGPSRARYTSVGELRATSEKELILCNLIARRETLLRMGGFNEALYPNEENALMDELQKQGGILLYDPSLIVHRRPRSSVRAFMRMLKTYGRGRAEQFRLHPTMGSALNFIPPLFLIYLLLIPALFTVMGSWSLLLLVAYSAAVMGQAFFLLLRAPPARVLPAVPFIVLTHILYGAGFWRGLFTRLHKQDRPGGNQVTLETIHKGIHTNAEAQSKT